MTRRSRHKLTLLKSALCVTDKDTCQKCKFNLELSHRTYRTSAIIADASMGLERETWKCAQKMEGQGSE